MLIVRAVLLAAALIVAGVALAASEPPIPGGRVGGSQQQAKAGQAAQNPAADQRGTEDRPLVVKSLAPEKSASANEQERKEAHEKAANERGLVVWTIVLAIATIVLAGVAGGQLWMFKRQLKIMEAGVEDAKTVAEAAKTSSEMARSEFIATHRPRVIVRRMKFVMAGGAPAGLQYTVQNIGDTACTITKDSCGVWVANDGEIFPRDENYKPVRQISLKLMGGESKLVVYSPIDDAKGELAFLFAGGSRAPENVFCLGFLDYADQAGTVRQTGFMRQYIGESKSFRKCEHEDYEYCD